MWWRLFVVVAAGAGSVGCGVERVDETSGARRLPPEVAGAFERSCNRGSAVPCHTNGAGGVTFDATAGFLSTPGIVVAGDARMSRVGIRILDGSMPPEGFVDGQESDRFTILGWIAAGTPLDDAEPGEGSTGGTGDELDSSTETGMADTGIDPADYDAFVPILAILSSSCGGSTCHRDGGLLSPVLDDDVAYANLVGVNSVLSSDQAPYVDPGNPAGSHLVRRVRASDGFSIMPPASDGDPLAEDDIVAIEAWIDAGAPL